jgi:hypothetical protein
MLAHRSSYASSDEKTVTAQTSRPEAVAEYVSHSRALAVQTSMTVAEQVKYIQQGGRYTISHW